MTKFLDTTGLQCPLPVLKAKKAMKEMAAGDTITVTATDPSSLRDFEAYCEATGDKLLESTEEAGIFTYVIEKGT